MAEVFLARREGPALISPLVVLKRMLPEGEQDPESLAAFLDEARLLCELSHPNVVRAHGLERIEDRLSLVLEHIRGRTLAQVAKRARRLPVDIACHVISEAAGGLHAAHELTGLDGVARHVVHRDVTPANVMVTYDGHVKLLDFGIARAEGRQVRTATGVLKGTLPYLSPEALRGEAVDRRSDVFSLGILLWELLTGERLFRRPNELATLSAILDAPIAPPSALCADVDAAVDRVVLAALSRDPSARPQTAAALRDALATLARSGSDTAPVDRTTRWMKAQFHAEMAEEAELLATVVERPAEVLTRSAAAATPPSRESPVPLAPEASPTARAGRHEPATDASAQDEPTATRSTAATVSPSGSAQSASAARRWAPWGAGAALLLISTLAAGELARRARSDASHAPPRARDAIEAESASAPVQPRDLPIAAPPPPRDEDAHEAEPAQGPILIITTPANVTAQLGALRCSTPCELPRPQSGSTARVRLSRPGYRPRTVTLSADDGRSIEATLTRSAAAEPQEGERVFAPFE